MEKDNSEYEGREGDEEHDVDLKRLLEEKIDESQPRKIDPQLLIEIEQSKHVTESSKNDLISSLLEANCDNPHEVIKRFNLLNEQLESFTEKQAADLESYLKHLKSRPIIKEDIKDAIKMICRKNFANRHFNSEKLEEYMVNDEYLIESVNIFVEKMYKYIPKPFQSVARVVWHFFRAYEHPLKLTLPFDVSEDAEEQQQIQQQTTSTTSKTPIQTANTWEVRSGEINTVDKNI